MVKRGSQRIHPVDGNDIQQEEIKTENALGGKVLSKSEREDMIGELSMLADVVKKQQDIIVTYAGRYYRPEQSFRSIKLDDVTSRWLDCSFGSECSLVQEEKVDAYNTADRLKSLYQSDDEALRWSFDIFAYLKNATQGDQTESLITLANRILDLLLAGELPFDLDLVKKAAADCIRAHNHENPFNNAVRGVDILQSLAYCYSNMRPTSGKTGQLPAKPGGYNAPVISSFDILASIFAALIVGVTCPAATDEEYKKYFKDRAEEVYNEDGLVQARSIAFFKQELGKHDFLAQCSPIQRNEFFHTLKVCVKATEQREQWRIIQNMDLLTSMVLSLCKEPKGTQSFSDRKLMRDIFLQGVFCAAYKSTVCRGAEVAENWVQRITKEFQAQGRAEKALELPVHPYSADVQEESQKRVLLALIALNFVDFAAAPLWVTVLQHCPGAEEPLGFMYLNRSTWSTNILQEKPNEQLMVNLQVRDIAFEESFEHVRFDAKGKTESPQNVSSTAIVKTPDTPTDFIDLQDRTLKITGSTVRYLSCLGLGNLMEKKARESLAQSIGLIQKQEEAATFDMATRTTMLRNNSEMVSASGRDAGFNLADHVDLTTSSSKHSSATLVVLPKSFIQKDENVMGKEVTMSGCQKAAKRFLDSTIIAPMLAILTIFALFGDDFKLATLKKSADEIFGIITLVTFVLFIGEMLAKIAVQPKYNNSFFFWLDAVATLSLVPDIPFIWEAFIETVDVLVSENDADDLSVTRAGRASRAGARAARVVRILRLVRLLRILKLYQILIFRHNQSKLRSENQKDKAMYLKRYVIKRSTSRDQSLKSSKPLPEEKTKRSESKVGAKLAELTTRRVITIVLIILFMLPVINTEEENQMYDVGIGIIHDTGIQYKKGLISEAAFNATIEYYLNSTPNLVVLSVDAYDRTRPLKGFLHDEDVFRDAEIRRAQGVCYYTPEDSSTDGAKLCNFDTSTDPLGHNLTTYGSFDSTDLEIESAWRSILQTLFIVGTFGITTMMFTYDAHKLVIAPIERMVRIVEELAENPLATFENEDSDLINKGKTKYMDQGGYETKLLENCIKKIGGLLQVGFGQAGAEIIASNMNASGELDPMIPGTKVQAVFGFCDIRDFMATTEVLQESVLLFANEIANIVHTQVGQYAGDANRNFGDGFFLVWKRIPASEDSWTQIAEKALIAFLKINIQLTKSPELLQYTSRDAKAGKLLRKAIPDFTVRLGFGLHVGWAIEGAIGSNKKLDASYLSPHVNLAIKLQAITRNYGSHIIYSDALYKLLGEDAKKCSRILDCVKFKGLKEPVTLYTFDSSYDDLQNKLQAIRLRGDSSQEDEIREVVDRRISLIGPSPIIGHSQNLAKVQKSAFRTDLEIRALQWDLPPHFLPLCRKGINVYMNGRWKEAKVLLEAAIKMVRKEKKGPAAVVLEFMAKTDFKPPDDWKGYRTVSLPNI